MRYPTFVTGFFDAASLDRAAYRSTEMYLRLFLETHHAVPFPLIVYVDATVADDVRTELAAHVTAHSAPRDVIDVPIETLPRMNDRRTLASLRRIQNAHPQKDTLPFAILTWAKPWLMERAATVENRFDATHLGWIDFGLPHVCDPASVDWRAIASMMPDQIRVCEMRATSPSELDDRTEFYRYNRGKIASGFFTGSVAALQTLRKCFDDEVERVLATGAYALEEGVFGALTANVPELFDRWYADYPGILANYAGLRRDVDTALDNLGYCRALNLTARGVHIFDVVKDAMLTRRVRLSPEQIARYLFDGFVCFYYEDRGRARELGELMALLLQHGTDKINETLGAFEPQLSKNLAFVGIDVGDEAWTRESLFARPDLYAWMSAL